MSKTSRIALVALLIYVFLVYFYLVNRFNGAFIEADTNSQTQIIYQAQQANSLLNSSRPYSNGFAYTAISLFLVDITGVSIQTLQVIIYPLITVFLVLVVFITYRLLTSSTKVGLLATLLIFLQPDFIFVTWRGSHERITWFFSLLLLFCICKSFVYLKSLSGVARFMGMFYLFAIALVSTNTLFASSFTVGLALSFIVGYLLLRVRHVFKRPSDRRIKRQMLRLFYMALSLGIVLYIFVFYIYPPARDSIQELGTVFNKVAVLTLNTEPTTQQVFNPYATFISFLFPVYVALTLFTWVILGISAIGWFKYGLHFLRGARLTINQLPRLILWLTYAAYAIQLVLSAFADRSGALTGNLQVRIFTPVTLLVMPLGALTLWDFFQGLRYSVLRRGFVVVGMVAVIWFSATSLLKASIDPLVGYKWIFNTEPEQVAENWIATHVPAGNTIWSGFDERLSVGAYFDNPALNPTDIRFVYSSDLNPVANYYLFSTVEEMRWVQLGRPLLDLDTEDRIYDNGTGIVYRRRPRTPYQ